MRPVTDGHKISRAKLSYLIDATAAPICIIAPISSWAAAVTGFVEGEDGFSLFLRAIPYNFYSLLTLVFVIAIGVYEGEKWGSVMGLVAAFIIQALGSSGTGPELLSLLYMPVGCAAGLLSKYYLRHTFPVNAAYILIATIIKEIFTVISAMETLNADLIDVITKIAVPEYFSTVLISPLPFLSVWIVFKIFHKTRAQRTDSIVN